MFITEGPLDPQSPLFVGREAELRRMEEWLAHGNCVGAVAGARQTGKTSLLLQLRHRFQTKYRFVFIDLEALQNAAEGDCYGFICREILDQLSDDLSDVSDCALACNSASFLAFLRDISRKISTIRIAVILDEIGALPEETAKALASTIRAIFTSRHVRSDYARYVFILSGSTDIRRFATGQSSPIYNVTEKVYLADLSLREADLLLVEGFGASGLQVSDEIRNRVLHWTSGHPYLTQLLGKRVAALWEDTQTLPDEGQVDQIVGDLLQEEDKSLPHMRRVLDKGSPRLWNIVMDTLQGKKLRFSRSNDDVAELELAGAIIPQSGTCVIRNRIFEAALSSWLGESRVVSRDTVRSTGGLLTGSLAGVIQPMQGLAAPLLRFSPQPTSTVADPDLTPSLATGNACAFVGAGLSVGAGLPGWHDLIAELAGRIGRELPPAKWATGDALIDAAQAYVNRQGLHSLISHLKDRLDTTGVQPTAAHRALARLPISLVFTANFDDLLERAFREAGKRVEAVVKDSSIPFMRRGPDTVNIVKLYGDLDQPDTIVLARQQYESYFLQRPQMVKLLETELARSDMLYLGWSGSDPYFKLVFGELLSRFGQMMRPGYAVMFDVTDDQRDELRRKQIRLVELPAGDRTAQLAEWLEDLAPAAVLPEAFALREDKEAISFEVRFTGDHKQAVLALASLKAPWYLFIRQSNTVLFGLERETTDPITDTEMHQLLPTVGRITCGGQWKGGWVLTITIPSAHKERLMPYWGAIKARLETDGWLERTQDSIPEGSVPTITSVKGEGGPAGTSKTILNTGKAWAVLVGVNQYENQPHIPSLHVCVDDVTAVHAALSGKYTAARLLTDDTPERLPTRANILGELNSVAQAAGDGDLLLFYFSGHGIAEGGESYLLPRDARLSALKHTAVAMKDVREIVEASPARAKVIVLDACHSGAAIGKAGPAMTPEFIQRVFTEAEGMAVLASCKQGQQSWEWPEAGRSVFTHFLLEALNGKADFDGKGLVTMSDANRYVTDGVKAWGVEHGVPQTPTLQYTVAGDIVLLKV